MKVGIMQPYFLPYLGYYQLINAVDKFLILDDVNYINKGYINRNNILLNNQKHQITLSLKKASQNKLIREIEVSEDDSLKRKLLKTIEYAYRKAPFYSEIAEIVSRILAFDGLNLSAFLHHSILEVTRLLKIDTEIIKTTSSFEKGELKGENRIISLVKEIGGSTYVNPIGGFEIYSRANFFDEGIELKFIEMGKVDYKQFENEFVPNLSVLDVLMFNATEEVKKMLLEYRLI